MDVGERVPRMIDPKANLVRYVPVPVRHALVSFVRLGIVTRAQFFS